MKWFLFFVFVFLFVGGYMIYESMGEDLDTTQGKVGFVKQFFRWVFNVGNNVKDITGYAVEKSWMPELNDTNETEIIEVKLP